MRRLFSVVAILLLGVVGLLPVQRSQAESVIRSTMGANVGSGSIDDFSKPKAGGLILNTSSTPSITTYTITDLGLVTDDPRCDSVLWSSGIAINNSAHIAGTFYEYKVIEDSFGCFGHLFLSI